MQAKFVLFGWGYEVHSFVWILEQTLDKLVSPYLRSEMHRACADIECKAVTVTEMREPFNKVMDTLNSAIDLVSKLQPSQQQGLNLHFEAL